MSQSPNPKLFLMMAGAMLIAGSSAVFVQYSAMSKESAKVASLRKEVRDEGTMRKELDQSSARLTECSAELTHLEQSVSEDAYVPTMLTDLEKTGRENGIVVLGVRPIPKAAPKKDAKEARKPYNELDIEVKGTGNYGSVMKFVKALNTFPKIVAARMVMLSPKVDTTKLGPTDNLDVQINLRAYVFNTGDKSDAGVKQNG